MQEIIDYLRRKTNKCLLLIHKSWSGIPSTHHTTSRTTASPVFASLRSINWRTSTMISK